jgi:hypothetical protein
MAIAANLIFAGGFIFLGLLYAIPDIYFTSPFM